MKFNKRWFRPSFFLAVTIIIVVAIISGCDHQAPYSYVKVSGKVTFEDDTPFRAGLVKVVFTPQNVPDAKGPKPRSGVAELNATDGTFDSVTSHRDGDGILAGEHRVTIVVIGPNQILAPEYSDPNKTPLKVNTDDAPFHLKVKRLK